MNIIQTIHFESVALLMVACVWILCHKHRILGRSWLIPAWASGLAATAEVLVFWPWLRSGLLFLSAALFMGEACGFLHRRGRWLPWLAGLAGATAGLGWEQFSPGWAPEPFRLGAFLWLVSVCGSRRDGIPADGWWLAWLLVSGICRNWVWDVRVQLAAVILLFLSVGGYALRLPFFEKRDTHYPRSAWVLAGLLSISVLVCVAATEWVGRWGDRTIRGNLLEHAEMMRDTLRPEALQEIATSEKWWELPAYNEILAQLSRVAGNSSNIRFVYLMKMEPPGRMVFLVDGEVEEASSPGDVYDDASEAMRSVITAGRPVVEGPEADEWGVWISALVPFRGTGGRVLGLVGMDMSAKLWQDEIARYRMVALWTSGLLCLIAFGSYLATMEVRDQALRLVTSEAQSRLLGQAVEQSGNGILIADVTREDAPLIYVNKAFEGITGYSAEEVLGKNCRFLQGAERNQPALADVRAAIRAQRPCRVTMKNFRKDGTLFWNSLSLSPLFDSAGRLTHYIGVQTDITRQKNTETELRSATEAAQNANRAKSAFLAAVSHELRTPLHGIIGSLDMIPSVSLPHELRGFHESIQSSAEHALQLINDILDFSKIESGEMKVEQREDDLLSLLDGAVDTVRAAARAKQLPMHVRIRPGVPRRIVTDHLRLRQIVVNLLANAVKFTQAGHVLLEVEITGDRLVIRVHDTGIGIGSDKREQMFQPFVQQDMGMARRFGGTGLGLAISRKLAGLLGGSVDYESELGMGSRFYVSVPLVRGRETRSSGQARFRLAIRGGVPLAREALAESLEALGAEASLAGGGDRLEVAWQDDAGVAHALVMDEATGTGHPGDDHSAEYPPRLEFWDNLIQHHAAAPAAALPDVAALKKWGQGTALSILVAEDNPVNLRIAVGMLQRLGIGVDVAVNGVEAVQAASSKRYDLILMDIQMPEMDGLEAMKQIISRGDNPAPYFVAVTANAMVSDREIYLSSGFGDVLSKPFRMEDLVGCLRRCRETKS